MTARGFCKISQMIRWSALAVLLMLSGCGLALVGAVGDDGSAADPGGGEWGLPETGGSPLGGTLDTSVPKETGTTELIDNTAACTAEEFLTAFIDALEQQVATYGADAVGTISVTMTAEEKTALLAIAEHYWAQEGSRFATRPHYPEWFPATLDEEPLAMCAYGEDWKPTRSLTLNKTKTGLADNFAGTVTLIAACNVVRPPACETAWIPLVNQFGTLLYSVGQDVLREKHTRDSPLYDLVYFS